MMISVEIDDFRPPHKTPESLMSPVAGETGRELLEDVDVDSLAFEVPQTVNMVLTQPNTGLPAEDTEPVVVATPKLTAAQGERVTRNLGRVRAIASHVATGLPQHADLDDLIAEGILGLTDAAARYDETRGVKFTTFATQRVRGAMLDYLRSIDPAARSTRKMARVVDDTSQQLASKLHRRPTDSEIAAELGIPPERMNKFRHAEYRGVVLELEYVPTRQKDDDLTPADVAVDTHEVQRSEAAKDQQALSLALSAMTALTERQQLIILASYLEGRNLEDIGRELGVTESAVSLARTKAMNIVRDKVKRQLKRESVGTSS